MNKTAFMEKLFFQIGIFVISGLLAGILLLAIQTNKLPGIKSDNYIFQNDEITPVENKTTDYENNNTDDLQNKTDNENLGPFTIHENKQTETSQFNTKQKNEKQPESHNHTNEQIVQTIKKTKAVNPVIESNNKKLVTVSAACGVSPMFFAGQNFVNTFFQKNSLVFTPCSTIGIYFPQNNNLSYSIIISGASSVLNLQSQNLYEYINLNFKTTFCIFKIDFSIMHTIFTNKNTIEVHLGTGIAIFNKPFCFINELTYNTKNTILYALDFGFSLRHSFNDRFFAAAVCDFSLFFPYSERLLIIQPSLIAGINL